MTNTAKFREKVKEKGVKIGFLATKCNISREWLNKKINNEADFKAGEIETITKTLGITKRERDEIFFAKDSELNSQKEVK